MDTLGQVIAALRTGRCWSQGELAAALREASGRPTVTREEVSRWENGRRSPTPYWTAHLEGAAKSIHAGHGFAVPVAYPR